MKRLYSFLWVCIVAVGLHAQEKPLFIFDQFINAKIHFKNRSVTIASLNYDAVNDKMFFMQNDDLMELTNFAMIDSIVWAGKRCFVSHGQGFLEQVKMENGTAFIRWKIKNVNVGSAGALGAVTQAKVETISVRAMGVFSATDATSNSADVYQQKNANEYYIGVDGNFVKINSVKQAQKLFPAQKEAIQAFAKEHKINMKEPLSALEFLNYCLGL